MYQTLPCLSCAYQSKVRSTGLPVLGDGVANDGARDAEDLLGLMRHDLVVGLRGRPAHALVVEGRAGLQGPGSGCRSW